MNITETMAFIHDSRWRGSKPGLSRTRALLAALGNPERRVPFVHIAGTNGKGSTAACIESIMRCAGYKTGLYTSPYIVEFGERMRINGENIPAEKLCRLAERICPAAESLADTPTEFELVTAMAFCYFAEENCDLVILEAGLGGETDATNVIGVPEAAVLTFMALDHTRELGPTLTDIARAKGGIIKEGCPVISAGCCPEADRVIRQICRERGCALREVSWDRLQTESVSLSGNRFSYDGLTDLFVSLAGVYQPKNGALAIETVRSLAARFPKVDEKAIYAGLAAVRWPGRFEVLQTANPAFVLDGGHNPHGVEATIESLQTQFPGEKIWFLMGVMADKDTERILQMLIPVSAGFITVIPDNPRALGAGDLAEQIEKLGGHAQAADSIAGGVRQVLERAGEKGVVCALGTLYFSGDVRHSWEEIQKSQGENHNS